MAHRGPTQPPSDQVVAPGDHMRARDDPKLLDLVNQTKCMKSPRAAS